jgi:hypothetical protein
MTEVERSEDSVPQSKLLVRAGGLTVEASGSNDYVSSVFNDLKAGIVNLIQAMPAQSLLGASEAPTEGPEVAPNGAKPSLVDFYGRCRPSAEHARVTVFAYYRKHYADTPVLDEAEAERMYNEVGEKLPNVGAALSNAARKDRGWLKRLGKGRYEISGAGENWVKTTFGVQ